MALETRSAVAEPPGVHSLLRIAAPSALILRDREGRENCAAGLEGIAPDWVAAALHQFPWVVMRRDAPRAGLLPVGIRGTLRSQRAPAWLPVEAVTDCITPRMLAARADWHHRNVFDSAAVEILAQVEIILTAHGFAGSWGPGGSVAAELAGGVQCTTRTSDLDLILYAASGLNLGDAKRLQAELSAMPVRVDALLETSHGGIALADLVGGADRFLLRTAQGPRFIAAAEGLSM